MAQPQKGDTVKVHYTGTLEDGTVFDSSLEREPLEFTVGSGMVIGGFDSAVEGLDVGEKTSVTIPPEQAYGEYNDDLAGRIPREQLPETITPELGMILQFQAEDGSPAHATISDMDDESITLDANHPLAGRTLIFEIELVEIV